MLTFLHVTYNIAQKLTLASKNLNKYDYIGYKHTMTHQDESALENHNKFVT